MHRGTPFSAGRLWASDFLPEDHQMADKSMVGRTGKPFKMPVEWSKVREFARAIKDPDPVYFDPEAAKKAHGGIPVPVTFLQTSSFCPQPDSNPGLAAF